jgi:hypothetical protein
MLTHPARCKVRSRFGLFMDLLAIPVMLASCAFAAVIQHGNLPLLLLFVFGSLGSLCLLGRVWAELDVENSCLSFCNGLHVWRVPFCDVLSMGWDVEDVPRKPVGHRTNSNREVISFSYGDRRVTLLATSRSPFGARARSEFVRLAKEHFRWSSTLEPVPVKEALLARQAD